MGRIGTGVETRATSIRLKFVLDGQPVKARLTQGGKSLLPTPANVKYAHRVAADIKRRLAVGTFDFAEFFPDSPRAGITSVSTFGALADLWLESKGQLEVATRNQYANAIGMWKRLLGGDTPLDRLGHQVLAAKIGGHPWASAKSCNNYLIPLRGIFEFEFRGRTALDNPMAGINNMTVIKKIPDPLSADERNAILADMREHYDPRITAYFTFMFYTGVRPEEAIALQWSDLNRHHRTTRIQRVRTFRGSERDGSKTHSERDVDLVAAALTAVMVMQAFTLMNGPDACIFENPVTGKPWHDERSQRDHYWTPTLVRLGIRHRRAYNTRHTYATTALMAPDVNPAYIARQLGHTSTQMLFSVYSKWIDGADKGAQRQALERAMTYE